MAYNSCKNDVDRCKNDVDSIKKVTLEKKNYYSCYYDHFYQAKCKLFIVPYCIYNIQVLGKVSNFIVNRDHK